MTKRYQIQPGLSLELPTPASFSQVWESSPVHEQFVRIESFINVFAEAQKQSWYDAISDVNYDNGTFKVTISDPSFLRHLLTVCATTAHCILGAVAAQQHPELLYLVDVSDDDIQDTDYGCVIQIDSGHVSVELVDSISGVFLAVN